MGAAVLVAVLALLAAGQSAMARAAEPSLRLIAASNAVRLDSRSPDLDLGLWVAAEGTDFRLNVTRPNYRGFRATQVDALTGAPLRSVPARLLDGWDGLKRFVTIRLEDARGRVVFREASGFCPNGPDRQRVDDSGPMLRVYPSACSGGSIFARGMVWGIERGWATALGLGIPGLGDLPPLSELPPPVRRQVQRELRRLGLRRPRPLRPGRYTATATIAPVYRRLFGVPTENASATVRVRVVRTRPRRRGHEEGGGYVEAAARTARRLDAASLQAPDAATLPDLVALPAWGIRVRRRRERDLLRFASTAWNAGPAPLVVEGYRRLGRRTMDAHQYFFDRDGRAVGRAPAGTMDYDARRGHHHWHFTQFVAFRLLRPDGRRVVRSRKQSFCLAPTDGVDLTVPGAELLLEELTSSVCGSPSSLWIRETLPVGWGDTYLQTLPGQAFDVTGLRNGRYLLEVEVNPRGLLHEVEIGNNVETRRIKLGGRRGARTVRVRPWRGIRD